MAPAGGPQHCQSAVLSTGTTLSKSVSACMLSSFLFRFLVFNLLLTLYELLISQRKTFIRRQGQQLFKIEAVNKTCNFKYIHYIRSDIAYQHTALVFHHLICPDKYAKSCT